MTNKKYPNNVFMAGSEPGEPYPFEGLDIRALAKYVEENNIKGAVPLEITMMFQNQKQNNNENNTIDNLIEAARDGDSSTQLELGIKCFDGKEVEQDIQAAVYWYENGGA